MVGYARDTEKKYWDKSIASTAVSLNAKAGPTQIKCVGATSDTWEMALMPGGTTSSGPTNYMQDLLKGVPQGTTATSRIGNRINVKYLKGNITLTANYTTNSSSDYENAQFGEAALDDNSGDLSQYLRTTYRVAIVRDLMVNNTGGTVKWTDVFASLESGAAGVHSELNVNNMGRFRVLMDKVVLLDGDDPQKTIPFKITGIGKVRYNGPTSDGTSPALTDTGVYIVWACLTTGVMGPTSASLMSAGRVLVNSRMCFTDC